MIDHPTFPAFFGKRHPWKKSFSRLSSFQFFVLDMSNFPCIQPQYWYIFNTVEHFSVLKEIVIGLSYLVIICCFKNIDEKLLRCYSSAIMDLSAAII